MAIKQQFLRSKRITTTCSFLITAIVILPAHGIAATSTPPGVRKPLATPACGLNCSNLFSLALGQQIIQNADVPGDTGVGGMIGQTISMQTASNSSPNEDFTIASVGTINDFCTSSIFSSYICNNYPSTTPVFEWNWSPFGNASGLCTGLASTPTPGQNVTLQNCGVSASTLWFNDDAHTITISGQDYTPMVNGASVSASFMLTVDQDSNLLKVQSLNINTCNVIPVYQLFASFTGPVI